LPTRKQAYTFLRPFPPKFLFPPKFSKGKNQSETRQNFTIRSFMETIQDVEIGNKT